MTKQEITMVPSLTMSPSIQFNQEPNRSLAELGQLSRSTLIAVTRSEPERATNRIGLDRTNADYKAATPVGQASNQLAVSRRGSA